jgi:methanogenic corrinoid protein MtbC1
VLVDIGDRWHRGEITSTAEHFATNYLLQRLSVLLRTVPASDNGALIWVGCAPGEHHEVGALLVTIYLRRAGHHVHYFGQDIEEDDIVVAARRHRPAMILLSASIKESAGRLAHVSEKLAAIARSRPLLGYGGRIFEQHPELRDDVVGVYMGATAQDAVSAVDEALSNTVASMDAHNR